MLLITYEMQRETGMLEPTPDIIKPERITRELSGRPSSEEGPSRSKPTPVMNRDERVKAFLSHAYGMRGRSKEITQKEQV